MRRRERAPPILCSVWLAGCATSALDMAPSGLIGRGTPPPPQSGEIIAGERGISGAADGYVLPTNPALASIPPPLAFNAAKEERNCKNPQIA